MSDSEIQTEGEKWEDNCLCSTNHHLMPLGRVIMASGPFCFDGGIIITKIN